MLESFFWGFHELLKPRWAVPRKKKPRDPAKKAARKAEKKARAKNRGR